MNKAKIFIEMEKRNSTTENFQYCFSKIMRACGFEARFKFILEVTQKDLNWCNVYIAVRPNTPSSLAIAQKITASGRLYIVYFDDDLLNRKGALGWRIKCGIKCLKLADIVLGANELLCKEYAQYTKTQQYYVLNTPVEEKEYSKPHRIGDRIQFVYAAGRDHGIFFEKLLKPILREFLEKYHNRVHFTFIGVEPDIKTVGYADCFSFIPLMPLDRYTHFMRSQQFNVGLAPLDQHSFSQRKYFNKYIEYTKAGIAGIYSDNLPYTLIVQDAVNGYLVDNTSEAWLAAITYIVDHPYEIQGLIINAQKILRQKFNLNNIASNFLNSIPEMTKAQRYTFIRWSFNLIQWMTFSVLDKTKKIEQQIRCGGMKSATKLVSNHIKDKTGGGGK